MEDVVTSTSNIKWREQDDCEQYYYIDLSSVNIDNHSIEKVSKIDKTTAPSRAQQVIHEGDVLFATTRPMQKRNCIVSSKYDGQICSTGYCVLRPNRSIVLSKWIYYITSCQDFYNYVEQRQEGTSYPSISDKNVKKYSCYLPSIEEQEKIVSVLDSFEVLVNNLSIGLPAEIKARQKQYEYYRDQLLNFKEKV